MRCSGISSVISLATIPPLLGHEYGGIYHFLDVPCDTLTVSCGCVSVYETSSWHDHFTTIEEDCTGVVEDDASLVIVYPNPTSSIVHVEAENLRQISVFNELGQQVYESPAEGNEFELDLADQEPGIYFIRIETASGITTKRVVLTK